ncbi:hypothetical protein NDS46_19615 [Paenibacillus thiaminolyticus]|uniref:hypothetical protein n=1 Tax=Paenibacillus thiaminolyticus TaxID=49283 RepID=UPI00232C0BB0|nr:hypothetical protein [Paenibacillus thiaminolyticus]WCF06550.1 hypothetical protein NDS46_19615 [Paenibacillus thiaminolyticus]
MFDWRNSFLPIRFCKDRQLIYPHGGINGFTASFLRLPQPRVAVIVLSNVAWPVTSELAHELAAMFMPH